MASEKDATCANDPNFAIICAFFQKFSVILNVPQPDIHLLQIWLENTDEVPPGLKELHIKLLRKLRKTVHESAWETALVKFCYGYSSQDAWEIERFGYKKSSLKVKLRILKEILECQFERNGKFRSGISALSAADLREQPIGRDKLGHAYWLTQDLKCNLRIYQEHLDEEIWQVVASNRDELSSLIHRLKGNEVVLPSLVGVVDEDSSSNSCPVAVVKQPPPEEHDESQDERSQEKIEEKVPNIKIKLDSCIIERSENGFSTDCNTNNGEHGSDSEEDDENEGEEEESEDDDEEEEESEEEGEEEEDDEDDDEQEEATVKKEGETMKIANGKMIEGESLKSVVTEERKVKPIVISQSKGTVCNEETAKKRPIENDSPQETVSEQALKKPRPTLLDSSRKVNVSKYEKYNEEQEEDDSEEEEEEGEEEEDEEEVPGDDEEVPEDGEDVPGEDEILENVKEICENEEVPVVNEAVPGGDEEVPGDKALVKDDNIKIEDGVGEAIKEEVLIIKGEGSGKDCEGSFLDFIQLGCDEPANLVGDEIEDETLFVVGEGSGVCCLVGNSKDETEKKPVFFFGQPGCLKLSPIKKGEESLTTMDPSEEDTPNIDTSSPKGKFNDTSMDNDEVSGLKNGEKFEKIECTKVASISIESDEQIYAEDLTKTKKDDAKRCVMNIDERTLTNSHNAIGDNVVTENVIYVDEDDSIENIPEKLNNDGEESVEIISSPAESEKNAIGVIDVSEISEDAKDSKSLNDDENENENSQSTCQSPIVTGGKDKIGIIIDKSTISTRKRRLSDDKCQKFIISSDSDSDFNSEGVEDEIPEDGDIGGKRIKMRTKLSNTELRRKVEEQRNNDKEESSSSEEDRTEPKKKLSPKKLEYQSEDVPEPSDKTRKESKTLSEKKKEEIAEVSPLDKLDERIASNTAPESNTEEELGGTCNAIEVVENDLVNINENFTPIIKTRGGRPFRGFGKRGRRGRGAKVHESSRIDQINAGKKPKTDENAALDESEPEQKEKIKKENENEKPDVSTLKTGDNEDMTEAVKTAIKGELKTEAKTEISDNVQLSSPTQEEEGVVILQIEVKPNLPKKNQRRKREIDTSNIIDTENDTTPVRQSRRIAQLKIREEAERRKLEEIALKKMKADLNKKKKEENKYNKESEVSAPSEEECSVESDVELKKKVEKKKRSKKKGCWSSGSEEEDEEEEEFEQYEHETDVGSPLFRSDHEFSPESDIEDDSQAVPLKRARTAKKEGETGDTDAVENLDESCQKCGKNDHPEWILLCDKCDKGYHCSCLIPVLFIIPEGDWFCPPCQQEQLIESLEQHLKNLDETVQKNELEEKLREESIALAKKEARKKVILKKQSNKRRKKMQQKNNEGNNEGEDDGDDGDDDEEYDGENGDSAAENSSSSSSSSPASSSSSSSSSSATDSEDEPIYKLRKRRQINLSYRFHEYDDLINSAIKEEMDEVAGAGNLGRGKDISTIIEADKEEKLRQRQLEAKLENDKSIEVAKDIPNEKTEFLPEGSQPAEVNITTTNQSSLPIGEKTMPKDDSGSDFEPAKRKPKMINKIRNRKKNRKLNSLDISSDDDGSDEDFKTSSYETEDEEESQSVPSESDSSLEVYKRKNKKNKKEKGRRSARRATRERRKRYDDDFIVDDSDASVDFPKKKKKRKDDSDYSDSASEDELSEDLDSEDLCDDTTSDESDGAWRPSKRKKQKTAPKKRSMPQNRIFGQRKSKPKRREADDGEKSFKPVYSKKKRDYDNESVDSARRTRGKRFTYLEDYDDESSDDGIKPGVKRPDTPPEEREQFIRKQEEIKRMLAERNTEAAKAAATPKLVPINKPGDSLSTVPASVIKGAKALDIDYLQRKGELESDPETDFDDDLPDDFNPEDMDEEEIAKMMEEEDFAQQQLKLAGEVIRQKKIKETDAGNRPEVEMLRVPKANMPVSSPDMRKRAPMPAIQSLLSNTPVNKIVSAAPSAHIIPPHRNVLQHTGSREPLIPTTVLSVQTNNSVPMKIPSSPARSMNMPTQPVPQAQQTLTAEPPKPRGRRKKITPLRDTLQKQQAAAAAAAAAVAAAAAASTSKPAGDLPSLSEKVSVIAGTNLSVAQPPQLYKPTNTPASVITRLPQHGRPRFADPSLAARFYSSPNQLIHRPPIRHGISIAPHLALRPSYANGPPPLRSANSGPPISIGNGIPRHPPQRPPFTGSEPFPGRGPSLTPYRPPLYGTPGYPPAPPSSQPPAAHHASTSEYQPPFTNYFAPTIGSTHSTPPPPAAGTIANSLTIGATPSPPPQLPPPTSEIEPLPPTSRPNATTLETFNTKATPPLETEAAHSPYATSVPPESHEDDPPPPASVSTSEFSGLVSYFSSQQDDLNT